jgi:hypothetical protein
MTVHPSGEAELQEFEATYARLVAEAFGPDAASARELVAFDEELIQGAGHGDVPHRGRMHRIAPGALDPTDEAVIRAGAPRPPGARQFALVAAGIFAPLLVGGLLIAALFPPGAAPPPTPAPPSATPVRTGGAALAPPTASLPPAPTVAAGFVTVAGQPLPELRPNTLELGGRSFLVYVAPVQNGNWLVRPSPAVANWLPGATTNWAFALFLDPDDRDADAWLARLQPGLPVTLRSTADSRPHVFAIRQRALIQRTQTEFLDPHRAGLTIAIRPPRGDGDTRLLLQGVEQIDSEEGAGATATSSGAAATATRGAGAPRE